MSVSSFIKKNTPSLLTSGSIVTFGASLYLTAKAAVKADKAIKKEKERLKSKYTKKDGFLVAWKYYIPPAITAVTAIACSIASNTVSEKRISALSAACSISEAALSTYKEKVAEVVSPQKVAEIKDRIAEDKIADNPPNDSNVLVSYGGDQLFYDALTGRYFHSSVEKVKKAENDINRSILSEMFMSVNDLYFELGLPGIKLGDELGWDIDHPVTISLSAQLTPDNKPCIVLDFEEGPAYNFRH